MPTTAEQLYQEALSLPLEARADLTERLVATLAEEIPSEITPAQLDEVHRRVAQVESGEVALIPGDEALARVRTLLAEHRARPSSG
jgi:putative addiction module component (TIGR02574 family)